MPKYEISEWIKTKSLIYIKKRAPREEMQGFASLSYVVLTRNFNMNIVLNILVNVCNLFREVILDKNAIWYVNVRPLREVLFCNDYSL
ncbi:hypothetical protein BAC7755_57700 [Bacillus sp. MN7755]